LHKRKHTIKEESFDSIDTPEQAYWLGYLYADGNISPAIPHCYEVRLISTDLEHIQKFKDFLHFSGPIRNKGIPPNINQRVVHVLPVNCKRIVEKLISYGIVPNKTYDLTVPIKVPSDTELKTHYIRGCMDGDGTLSKFLEGGKKSRCSLGFTNCNHLLVNTIKDFFAKGTIRTYKHSPLVKAWQFSSRLISVLPLLDKLYSNSQNHIRLDRKYNKYLEIKSLVEVVT